MKWPYEEIKRILYSRYAITGGGIYDNALTRDINAIIDACKAAVEAAGLEYGLDYVMLEDLFVKHIFLYRSVRNQNVTIGGWESFKEAVKLAERKLIVWKGEVTK